MSQLLLVHLSDLHFGKHSRYAGTDRTRLGHTVAENIERARTELKIPVLPAVVVVSGDLVEMAKPAEFVQAQAFLRALHEKTALPRKAFVFVPGNHDLSWTDCKTIDLQREDDEFDDREWRKRIDEIKLQRFDRCVDGFYGEAWSKVARPLGHGAYLYLYPEHGLCVAALNSCERESHRSQDHLGAVGPEQAQAVMAALRGPECAPLLKCVVVHHHPDTTVPANVDAWRDWIKQNGKLDSDLIERYEHDLLGLDGAEHLRQIVKDCHVQLVLHGHHHAAKETPWNWDRLGQAHVISAGSFGLGKHELPQNQSNSLRLILLDPSERQLTAWSLVFDPRSHTPGTVGAGAYIPVRDEAQIYQQPLSLPARWAENEGTHVLPAAPTAPDPSVNEFLTAYRIGFADANLKWDLRGVGAVQTGGAARPIEANLDDIYQPLRLAGTYDIEKTDLGAVLEPETLLAQKRPLLITAPAGGGKTTWMRWTFRRLLEREDALPIMVVLRDVAKRWRESDCRGAKRGFENFLDDVVQEWAEGTTPGMLAQWLRSEKGPTPVLLVDGWDELGELGREFREKLGAFFRKLPHVRVVVTSRPYGESRPSGGDGFTSHYLQPLSINEIGTFAGRFFSLCHGTGETNIKAPTAEFLEALRSASEPAVMARTPLLLTMMLLVSRSAPLPDKRHELYDLCLRSLLTARPRHKEKEGALDMPEQWRPEDSDERFRAVAAIAFRIQEAAYERQGRGAIVRTLPQLAELCPANWSRNQKTGFILWLAGPAGVLTDRADETFTFTHLSFQEYLTAWQLHATVEGEEQRLTTFRDFTRYQQWWETLRLWAAQIAGQNPERLRPVFFGMVTDLEAGLWLAGTFLADGLADTECVQHWGAQLFAGLESGWSAKAEINAGYWSASRQDTRREALLAAISASTPDCRWTHWLRCSEWARQSRLPGVLVEPRSGTNARFLMEAAKGLVTTPRHLAVGRVLCGFDPLAPRTTSNASFLQIWPSARRLAGLRLQALYGLGLSRQDLVFGGRRVLAPSPPNEVAREFACDLARDLARQLARSSKRSSERDFAHDFARYLAFNFEREVARDVAHYFARNFVRDFRRYLRRYFARDSRHDLVRHLAYDLRRYFAGDLGRYFAHDLGVTDRIGADWGLLEFAGGGRIALRSLLSVRRVAPDRSVRYLLAAASRQSLHPEQPSAELVETLSHYPVHDDVLWPALARHIARLSTPEDRALLEDLARHPELREAPLSWGLQYIVRGDVVMDDGTVITLDELCDELGLPHLPYLEEMPPELEIDWDAKG